MVVEPYFCGKFGKLICTPSRDVLTWSTYISFQIDGISIRSLDDIPGGAVTSFFRSIRKTLDFDFEDDNEGWLKY